MKKTNIDQKYTKKASAYIMKYLLKEHPDISKLTSFDQAYVILMTDWGMEIDIYTNIKHHTKVNLYRDEEIIKVFEWDNIDTEEPTDLDWNIIYKEVLETIIKKKLYKKSKVKKQIKKDTKKELKLKKSNLYQKIKEWKSKDKDVSDLVKEYNEVSNKLK